VSAEKDKINLDNYEKALASYGQAVKAFRRGDCKKAIEYFVAFIEKYPKEKEIVDRARAYMKICEDRSKTDAIALKNFDDFYEMGVYRLNQGEYEEALKLFNKALEKDSDKGKIIYLIGKTHYLMGDKDKFLDNLKSAIQVDKSFKVFAQNDLDIEDLKDNKKFKLITKLA
jgi:tetratricopeptide (TPR) repeat protein